MMLDLQSSALPLGDTDIGGLVGTCTSIFSYGMDYAFILSLFLKRVVFMKTEVKISFFHPSSSIDKSLATL